MSASTKINPDVLWSLVGVALVMLLALLLSLVGALLPSAYSAGSSPVERPAVVARYGTAGPVYEAPYGAQISAQGPLTRGQ